MIKNIEKALSNRSRCNRCGNTIEVGSLRGMEEKIAFGNMSYKYYDTACTKILLIEQINNSKKILEQLG